MYSTVGGEESRVRRLRWAELKTGGALYHAAFFAAEPAGAVYRVAPHCHDFFEALLVLAGDGEHHVASANAPPRTDRLVVGDLVFLRPDDCHAIHVPPGGRLHWINIAFPADAWDAFRAAADLDAACWNGAPRPPTVHLARPERRAHAAALFGDALHRFQASRAFGAPVPDRLDLCRFLAEASRLLVPAAGHDGAEPMSAPNGPPWLVRACHALERDPEAIAAGGVARFVALSGVSYAHLARTLKATTGRTPTEYVNDLRLARAALLLTTTAQPIIEIALDCGFGQLSYFYRLFRRRFGAAPDAYRRAARLPLAPQRTDG